MSVAVSDKDSYSAIRPSRSEYLLTRINIKTPDNSVPIAGGSGKGLTPGEIAAAISMHPPALPMLAPFVCFDDAKRILDRLLWYKYFLDGDAGDELLDRLLCDVFLRKLLKERDVKEIRKELQGCKETLRRCTFSAIDEVCQPALYLNVSGREWARKLQLDNHMAWPRRWEKRYQWLRLVVQELDDGINYAVCKGV